MIHLLAASAIMRSNVFMHRWLIIRAKNLPQVQLTKWTYQSSKPSFLSLYQLKYFELQWRLNCLYIDARKRPPASPGEQGPAHRPHWNAAQVLLLSRPLLQEEIRDREMYHCLSSQYLQVKTQLFSVNVRRYKDVLRNMVSKVKNEA